MSATGPWVVRWDLPQAPLPAGAEEHDRPQFALVRAHQDDELHGLPPQAEGGPALCGVEPDADGWYLVGHTRWPLSLIPCAACRNRAAALLTTLGDAT
jgi:hypothetical protein